MALNTSNGLISGTPGTTKGATVYRITATNATGAGYYDWTESVISGCVPLLTVVPSFGDTAGGTSLNFKKTCGGLTGSTCAQVNSYSVVNDSIATGTSKAHAAGVVVFNVVVAGDTSKVNFTYTAGTSKKRRGWNGFRMGTWLGF
jgi:hypothetical protein